MAPRLLALLALAVLLLAACAPSPTSGVPRPTEAAKPAAPAAPAADRAAAPAPAASPAAGAAPAPRPAAPGAPAAAPALAPAAKPAAPEAQAQSQTAALPPITALNRMIIYNTQLTLLVRLVDEAVEAVGNIAVLHGGYVAGVENTSENGLPVSTVRIKVLPERYQAAMSQLHDGKLAVEVRDEKATTQDVTEEYSDLQTQLASLEATHRQLLDLLAKATTMEDILKIQQQAAQVKLQIDRLKGRATALERLSELATITVKLQSAEAVLGKDFVAVRSQLRQAEAQYAAQLLALKRARTPEEENKIRDTLGELTFQIDRAKARMNDLKQKADQASVALPTAPPEEAALTAPAQELPDQYIATRVQLRQAEARQTDITRRLKLSLPPEEAEALRKELSARILEINGLNAQLKSIQERAAQLGVTLPTLTAEQEAALAGTTVEVSQPDPLRAIVTAWDASLTFLRAALAAVLGVVVFLWWAIPLLGALALVAARRGLAGRWPSRRAAPDAAGPPA